jgi:hypothetical protein
MARSKDSLVVAARQFEQAFALHRLAGVGDERIEQREFAAGQRHRLAVARQLAAAALECPVAEAHNAASRVRRRWRARAAAQHGFDAGDQFARVEGFAEVIVGAHFEADHAVDRLVARGQHDHRSRLAACAQASAGGETVLAGNHQVEHHQLRLVAFEKGVELARIGQQQGVEAVPAEVGGEQLAQLGVVVDEENLFHGHGGGGNADHSMPAAAFARGAEILCNQAPRLAQ